MASPTQIDPVEIFDENDRIFKAWATAEVRDVQGELIPIDEFKPIMPVIMDRGGNLMFMHGNKQIGKILNYEFRDKELTDGSIVPAIYLTCKVFNHYGLDDMVWDKLQSGEFPGISFGGVNAKANFKYEKGGLATRVLKELEGFEFSVVDGMGNQEAEIAEINYIAKRDIKKEEGETSSDSGHYHLYKLDDEGMGKTLGTLPRDHDEHTHQIVNGIVQMENGHDHELIRELVPRVNKRYNSKKENSVDKTDEESQTKKGLTLLDRDENSENYIKKNDLAKSMGTEKDAKKIEDAPEAESEKPKTEDDNSTEKRLTAIEKSQEAIMKSLSDIQKSVNKTDDEDDKEDKETKKDDGGEKVKLEETEGEVVSQSPPAQGAEGDVASANFVEKSEVQKIVAEEIKKGLANHADLTASTPRPATENDIQKSKLVAPTNYAEANKAMRQINAGKVNY